MDTPYPSLTSFYFYNTYQVAVSLVQISRAPLEIDEVPCHCVACPSFVRKINPGYDVNNSKDKTFHEYKYSLPPSRISMTLLGNPQNLDLDKRSNRLGNSIFEIIRREKELSSAMADQSWLDLPSGCQYVRGFGRWMIVQWLEVNCNLELLFYDTTLRAPFPY